MSLATDLRTRIEVVEEAYEFFLAYAAQGVSGDQATKAGAQLRGFLGRAVEAIDGVAECVRELVKEEALDPVDAWADLIAAVEHDARSAGAALRLVAARASISSQLVDNLNANIHLRALLTDFFLLDELLPRAAES